IDDVTNPPTCRIIEVETGQVVRTISFRTPAHAVAWSTDGTTLAIPCDKIDLWDVATGIQRVTLEDQLFGGTRVAFHPAGTLLACDDWSGQLRLWDSVL